MAASFPGVSTSAPAGTARERGSKGAGGRAPGSRYSAATRNLGVAGRSQGARLPPLQPMALSLPPPPGPAPSVFPCVGSCHRLHSMKRNVWCACVTVRDARRLGVGAGVSAHVRTHAFVWCVDGYLVPCWREVGCHLSSAAGTRSASGLTSGQQEPRGRLPEVTDHVIS